jgi:hypothetical protein
MLDLRAARTLVSLLKEHCVQRCDAVICEVCYKHTDTALHTHTILLSADCGIVLVSSSSCHSRRACECSLSAV